MSPPIGGCARCSTVKLTTLPDRNPWSNKRRHEEMDRRRRKGEYQRRSHPDPDHILHLDLARGEGPCRTRLLPTEEPIGNISGLPTVYGRPVLRPWPLPDAPIMRDGLPGHSADCHRAWSRAAHGRALRALLFGHGIAVVETSLPALVSRAYDMRMNVLIQQWRYRSAAT